MRNVSIKDIAKITGVSTATVSRVINDNGRFSEDTRQKVIDAINKLGYRSNVVAKSLRTMRTLSIGVIVPDITNEFFSNIVLGIESYCFPNGYSVYICNTSESKEKENMYIADLEAKGVDGLIYLSGGVGEPNQIFNRRIPTVCIDREPSDKNIPVIESDNHRGGFIATEELIRCGCKNIVLLRDHRDLSTMNHRNKGYIDALNKYDIPVDLNLVLNLPINFESAKECVDKLIASEVKFDGIFAATDLLAVGALSAMKKHKIKVPQEIKLVGFDNILISEFVNPSITTINQDKFKMGETAAHILLELIKENSKKFENIVIPVELIRRETT